MQTMRQKYEQFMAAKQVVAFNFLAGASGKLISTTGTIQEVGEDYILVHDIYGNTMYVLTATVAYIEIKR